MFERSMHHSLYEYFIGNELISLVLNQRIRVSISYYHDIYQSFDNGFEVRDVLLDMSNKIG